MASRAVLLVLTLAAALGAAPARAASDEGCVACHAGIEAMHPEARLSCVDCHGGKPDARTKEEAHVRAPRREPGDERVAPLDEDLPWRRFRNPMDLRVAARTCGECHEKALEHLRLSLHGTTAGHLSDGYYEVGALAERGSAFAVFPVQAPPGKAGDVGALAQVPAFRAPRDPSDLAAHFGDLARKECLQCHLWSAGRAVRGRVGFDGDYRGEGCAACHVEYAVDGRSQSADARAVRGEPGHPRVHAMTRAAPTSTCTACHYGDASIGLNFRGLAQLPPGAPGGPEIPGTSKSPLHRQFFLQDPGLNPPDVHHERGLVCVDCHTQADVMGDGRLHGSMEHAVEIECTTCHGTFDAPATLVTRKGTRLEHVRREGDRVVLTSKADGREHPVAQLVHALDPSRPEHNPRAARAMTAAHAGVECSTCHAAWNPNFLGFHFDRNESLTQLDLLSGRRTPGRVTTQEKVFATWTSFYSGLDADGRLALYMTGFSSMGSVTDARGERVLDQALPVTAAGLSGMSMVHHDPHATRKAGRTCVECHRASQTFGLGSIDFRLARQVAFVADRRGIEAVALDRAQLARSVPLCKLVQPDVVALALQCDPLQGFARHLYAAEAGKGVHVFDVRDPSAPRRVTFLPTIDPRDLALAGDWLLVADGAGGLRILDVADPARPRELSRTPTCEARAVRVQWPYAYVADGPGGLWIVDVRVPIAPRVAGAAAPANPDERGAAVARVEVLFQNSRARAAKGRDGQERTLDARTGARLTAAVLDERAGLVLFDVTEPGRVRQLSPDPRRAPGTEGRGGERDLTWVGIALSSHVDLAQPQGGSRNAERDYAWLLALRGAGDGAQAFVASYDVTDPTRPRRAAQRAAGARAEALVLGAFYSAPFLKPQLLLPGRDGVTLVDVAVASAPTEVGLLSRIPEARAVALEEFPLDRMLDEQGRPLKDVSHRESRWLRLREIERILDVPAEALGLSEAEDALPPATGWIAAREFARYDADRSGVVTGAELAGAIATADRDEDGRVLLAEFAASGGLAGVRFEPEPDPARAEPDPARAEAGARTGRDGDLARLLDGVDPNAHDRDLDARLTRDEMRAAWFAALDLDADRKLTPAELSREPGAGHALRFADEGARALFARFDVNGNGTVEPFELQVPADAWAALDADGDGAVQLAVEPGSRADRSGRPTGRVEWPARQFSRFRFSPLETSERLLSTFDADGDGSITRREMQRRPDLFQQMDMNSDARVAPDEVAAFLGTTAARGVDVVREGFLERWDLDGDGRVTAREIPLPSWLVGRILGPAARAPR